MNRAKRMTNMTVFLLFGLLAAAFSSMYGQDYADALKGVKSVNAVFDFRIGEPKNAAMHLKLIQNTYKDRALLALDDRPDFTVIFIGPSVKLISTDRQGFSPEDQQALDEIAATVSLMAQDGIKLEVCLVAAKAYGLDPATVFPAIKQVPNGWVSEIGYQARGYSLVPAY
jgi:intracellular sulfur oxidation DsrE/DsrF family protein